MSVSVKLSGRFVRFAIAGAVGFLVDAGFLLLLTEVFGASPFAGRAASFAVALTATWLINRHWAFRGGGAQGAGGVLLEYLNYWAVQMTGGAVNLGVFALALLLLDDRAAIQLLAVAAGAVAGMFVNYFGNRALVFRGKEDGVRVRRLTIGGLWLAAGITALVAAALAR